MEHFIRIAFWIFTLLFNLSGCKSTPIPEDFSFDLLRENVTCSEDTKLYSPKDIMPKCFISALECVSKELFQTVKYECRVERNRLRQEAGTLQELIEDMKLEKGYDPTTSNECACEKWAEVPFVEFLNDYENLIQLIATVRRTRNTSS